MASASLASAFPTGAPSCNRVPVHTTMRHGAHAPEGRDAGGFNVVVLDEAGTRVESYVPGAVYTGAPLQWRSVPCDTVCQTLCVYMCVCV
jgi:hypothetical protein